LWEQVDEKTGSAESWFNIIERTVFTGTVVKMFQKSGDPRRNPRCTKCEGAEKDAPVLGTCASSRA
jgi:hypothetical protein